MVKNIFNNEYRGSVRFLFEFNSQFIFEHIEESYGVVPLKKIIK